MFNAGLAARDELSAFRFLDQRHCRRRGGSGRQFLSWSRTGRRHGTQKLTRLPCLNRAKKDLSELSSLGHFLKGSSATLGFLKVKDSCQVIQQYGHKLNLDGSPEPDEQVCIAKITEALQAAKDDLAKLETMLKKFFGEGSD